MQPLAIAFEKGTATRCFVLKNGVFPPKSQGLYEVLRTLPLASHVFTKLEVGNKLAKMKNHGIIKTVSYG
jgi:hypothetical protein